jgi:hypothetical protein
MGNYLKMTDKRRILALLELGWPYRRIERETGVRRETIGRYDPRRQAKAANLSAGSNLSADDAAANAANLSAGSAGAHGPPGLAAAYHEQIEAGPRQGLTAQRIWQDRPPPPRVAYPPAAAALARSAVARLRDSSVGRAVWPVVLPVDRRGRRRDRAAARAGRVCGGRAV